MQSGYRVPTLSGRLQVLPIIRDAAPTLYFIMIDYLSNLNYLLLVAQSARSSIGQSISLLSWRLVVRVHSGVHNDGGRSSVGQSTRLWPWGSWVQSPSLTQFNIVHFLILYFTWPHRLMVRTSPFHGGNRGSNPLGVTKPRLLLSRLFFI